MPPRRGHSTTALIATACVITGLGVAAVVVGPGATKGDVSDDAGEVRTALPEHQVVIERLAAVVRSSRELLAVHDRTSDPLLDVLLWLRDDENPGVIDDDEIGLISHSRLSHTVIYRDYDPEARQRPLTPPDGDRRDARFCALWRASKAVSARTIARGISDMRVRGIGGAESYDRVEIALTWPSNSVDGPDKASILVVVSHPEISAKE